MEGHSTEVGKNAKPSKLLMSTKSHGNIAINMFDKSAGLRDLNTKTMEDIHQGGSFVAYTDRPHDNADLDQVRNQGNVSNLTKNGQSEKTGVFKSASALPYLNNPKIIKQNKNKRGGFGDWSGIANKSDESKRSISDSNRSKIFQD